MSSVFRKLLVISAGAVLLAGLTAGTLSAASTKSKTYQVTVSTNPAPLPDTGGPATFAFTYLNNNPGTSTINSLTLTAPTTAYAITTTPTIVGVDGNYSPGKNYSIAVFPAGSVGVECAQTSSCIQVTNLAPMGYGQSLMLSFDGTVDASNFTCADVNGMWTPTAWTGSNLSGTTFVDSLAFPTTPIGTGTLLDANGGSTSVDGVTVTNNSSCAVPVNISRNGNSIQVLKPSISGVALTVDVQWYGVAPDATTHQLPPTRVDTPASLATYSDGTHNIQWCGGTPSALVMPTGEVSCLVTETSQIAGSNTVNVDDTIYLLGDWGAAKG
jgi:hypothetical protein